MRFYKFVYFGTHLFKVIYQSLAAREMGVAVHLIIRQPIADRFYCLLRFAAVARIVLSTDIRCRGIIIVGLLVQYKYTLHALAWTAIAFGAKRHAEFQRHVEPRHIRAFIQRYFGKIVDAPVAFFDQVVDFIYADLRTIIFIFSTARVKATCANRKYDSAKNIKKPGIKRAIYKNVIIRQLFSWHALDSPTQAWLRKFHASLRYASQLSA